VPALLFVDLSRSSLNIGDNANCMRPTIVNRGDSAIIENAWRGAGGARERLGSEPEVNERYRLLTTTFEVKRPGE
jgi:hypothetical protein